MIAEFKIQPLKRTNLLVTNCTISGVKLAWLIALDHSLWIELEEWGEDGFYLNVLGRQFWGKLNKSGSEH